MGRKRNDSSQGLPRRVYLRRGTFFYVHPDTNKWENLGKDLSLAKKRADHYNDPAGVWGTMTWYLDQFLLDCAERVKVKDLSKRTLQDYIKDSMPIRTFFGTMMPTEVKPHHVSEYLDLGAKMNRAVRANREKACLSSCMSWMLRTGQGAITVNPCMRASGVVRNSESQRERYVTDAEYKAVFAVAPFQVRLLMEMTYRTLQRPESDIIRWTPAVIKAKDGARVLSFRQHKTDRLVDVGLPDTLDQMIRKSIGDIPRLHQPLIHTREGEGYTYDGISAMLRRALVKVRETVPSLAAMESFGFRDLKGKGATDMWLAGIQIERIQMLCGHASKNTTEKYIKARWRETAEPNRVEMAS